MARHPHPHRHNLPAPLSTFIGRQAAIAEVKGRLSAVRLLTLTGPGGCGKTRLALRVASELPAGYPDGVWLVELAPLANPALVPQAVAAALGLREQVGHSLLDTLTRRLRSWQALLVLDNCEHLVTSCARLAESLLRSCPELQILATSRENLGILGEAVWVVPPLSLPDPQVWRNPSSRRNALPAYEKSEAVRLFIERAAAALPGFTLDEQNGPWVAEICRRLDGMPLAIELAAARVKVLKVEQIAQHLDDMFQLLTEGSRTALPRQQTLQATIEWSYNLLSGTEQVLLRRLSVFAGGWTLETAGPVCADPGAPPGDTLDTLAHLVEKSMIWADRSTGPEIRYRMLETIREYAWERLLESGETDAIQRRHAEAFLALARQQEHTESKLFWAEIATIEQLELDLDNFRTALAWCALEAGSHETGLRLASALAQFWQMRGYLSEARGYFENLLPLVGDVSTPARAEAYSFAGYLSIYAGDIERGVAFLEKSLALYRELGDKSGIAWQLTWLGWATVAQGDLPRAGAYARQAYAMQQALGDRLGAAVALSPLGEAEYLQGNFDQAAAVLEQSLALVQDIGNLYVAGRRLTRLGQVALARADLPNAADLAQGGLVACTESGDKSGITMALVALAGIAIARGELERSARLLGAVEALHEVSGTAIWYVDRLEYEHSAASLRAQLDQAALEERWEEGRGLALEQVMAYALSPSTAPAGTPKLSPAQAAKARFGGLTPRERETAALIAQGKTNREIAELMVVRVKTVETYVTRILNKLGFDSRVQIALWAVETGLASPPP